jgi:Holliday junction resolvase RusA-like endonuclease
MIEITVRGTPRPLSRTGHGQFGARYMTAPTSRQIGLVVDAWERVGGPRLEDEEPLELDCRFVFERPKSHYRTGRNAHLLRDAAPTDPIGRPDLDNLVKLVCEALQGNAFKDDSRVVTIRARKVFDDTARTEIRVGYADKAPPQLQAVAA